MNEPIINDLTRQELQRFADSNSHGAVLIGPFGAGKTHLAQWLAGLMLGVSAPSQASIKLVSPDNGTIGIDQVRDVQGFLRLKSVGANKTRRIIIIEDAQSLTIEAQNALLKILEEPPEDARIILTAISYHSLLPTVMSRLQAVLVHPVTKDVLITILKSQYGESEISRAYALSDGYVGLCLALLNDKEHELTLSVTDAKAMLGASTLYDRLLMVEAISKNKDKSKLFLFALKRILSAALQQRSTHQSKQKLERILVSLQAVYKAEAALSGSPNMKLLLTSVALNL